ncbi:MAG: hypothetical protein K2F58_02620 [Muribaculaceae bacterium]|nr:hypothetical protein [Muribaculaceae bacterium]
MLHYLKLMLQILMAPQRGWEDVEADGESSRHTLLYGLLPLVSIAAVSVGLSAFYELHPSATRLLVRAIVVFASYTISYFIGVALLTYTLPRICPDSLTDREHIEIFCAYCTGMMAAIGILQNLLPMELTLLQFLPIYVVVVICLGRNFVGVSENYIFRFAAAAITGIIVPVYLIGHLLLPAA